MFLLFSIRNGYKRYIQFLMPATFKINSSGQNLVKADCNKLSPTKVPSQSQLIFTVNASVTLASTIVPATARTILSFIIICLKVKLFFPRA